LDLIRNERARKKIRYYKINFTKDTYLNKPIYQELESETACWQREEYQRDSLARGLFDAGPEDIVIISDIDEIPSERMINEVKNQNNILDLKPILALEMDHFYGTILNKTQFWYHSKIVKFKNIRHRFSFIRLGSSNGVIRSAGWHFTSFGGQERLIEKVNSFSHTSAAEEENIKSILKKLEKENYNKDFYDTRLLPKLVFSDFYKDFFRGKGGF
jgi:beta-1,4-mannosyl-glycoprotein beta-1,4-N-acetylglucosaminyltransferase